MSQFVKSPKSIDYTPKIWNAHVFQSHGPGYKGGLVTLYHTGVIATANTKTFLALLAY